MAHLTRFFAVLLLACAGLSAARAQAPEPRIALVIGNSAYQAGSLPTPANDAGLIAQTLTQAGFDVIGARDLDQEGIRRSFRDFLGKAAAAGPNAVAFVYLSGYGLQYAGENYFAPIEAAIPRDSSVPIEALRLSDFSRALADIPLKARILVLDAARANPFAPTGQPLAGGLALVEPEPGSLIAFNAAPGTVSPPATGDYGPYARALAEMMQEGGLDIPEVFARTRLRVSEATRGAEAPWHASRLTQPVLLFERPADAPPRAEAPRSRAIGELPVAEAYALALERDTIASYQEFLAAYPGDPLSPRVEAMLAARREALTWRRAVARNTPAAYWSYIRRYPRGPHVADAHRRLAILSAALEPPPVFEEYEFDVPPPPPREIIYVSRPVLIFDDTFYPPPPPPVYLLPPPPREYIELAPPRIVSPGFLPVPVPVFLPSARPWRRDVYREPPPAPLPQGVTPRDPGSPPRFMAPTQSSAPATGFTTRQVQPNAPQGTQLPLRAPLASPQPNAQGGTQPAARAPLAAPLPNAPVPSPEQARRRQLQTLQPSRQLEPRRQEQGPSQQVQQQRDRQMRIQQQQQMRAQEALQQRRREQDWRAQQQLRQQQRAQESRQQMRQQQFQQERAQQLMQQRAQQQQFQQQQMRQQQMQQERAQQQMQLQRAQQQMRQQQMQQQQQIQQQQQMRQQQMQQQIQHQREQQQRAQQQQQQQRQQHQRNDCGVPGKPPCR